MEEPLDPDGASSSPDAKPRRKAGRVLLATAWILSTVFVGVFAAALAVRIYVDAEMFLPKTIFGTETGWIRKFITAGGFVGATTLNAALAWNFLQQIAPLLTQIGDFVRERCPSLPRPHEMMPAVAVVFSLTSIIMVSKHTVTVAKEIAEIPPLETQLADVQAHLDQAHSKIEIYEQRNRELKALLELQSTPDVVLISPGASAPPNPQPLKGPLTFHVLHRDNARQLLGSWSEGVALPTDEQERLKMIFDALDACARDDESNPVEIQVVGFASSAPVDQPDLKDSDQANLDIANERAKRVERLLQSFREKSPNADRISIHLHEWSSHDEMVEARDRQFRDYEEVHRNAAAQFINRRVEIRLISAGSATQ